MALKTQYPGYIAVGELPDSIIFGTCQLGDDFGQVKNASLKRTGDKNEILNCTGGLRALLLSNVRSEFNFKTLFTDDVAAPGVGERIVFPLLDDDLGNPVCGVILDASVEWDEKGGRMLSIDASNWDSLGRRPEVKSYDPTTETWATVADTVALPTIITE